ncbi:class I SAM-dependent methyltransferase [Candidatus Obscuribacterales bacterium]|nr:class I SAM-dependent methyltransferase [Candidatus Obscuribacterales bacterium]
MTNYAPEYSKLEKRKQTGIQQICRTILLGQFKKMSESQLRMTLEDGNTMSFGDTRKQSAHAHITVLDPKFYERSVLYGAIGFAESYIDGEWTTDNLTNVIEWFIYNNTNSTVLEESKNKSIFINPLLMLNRVGHILRDNTLKMSKKNIEEHYDLGNDFFNLILDETMTYSSAIFENRHESLAEAQRRKVERLCQKLQLTAKDEVLEIGCGWGFFAVHAAKNYGCKMRCVTLSDQQFAFVTDLVRREKLEHLITVEICDFRNVKGKYSKIVSIEMVEALGDSKVDIFFDCCNRLLEPNGILAIQMITTPDCRYDVLKNGVDFIQKHIFPGSQLLSVERVLKALNKCSTLHLVDLHDFAASYAWTLSSWRENFLANLDAIRDLGFDDRFIRKWIYYFCYCEAAFATRQISVVQVVFARPNNEVLAGKL